MLKINYMSTLFVGIDVSSKANAVYAMDFDENKYISSSFGNNQPGADKLVDMIAECMRKHPNLDAILIVLESTSVYSVHISNFLSTSEVLMPYKPYVFCVNPKATSHYRKSYIGRKSWKRQKNGLRTSPLSSSGCMRTAWRGAYRTSVSRSFRQTTKPSKRN